MSSSQSSKHIVVIGGGIVGVSTAYYLTRHALYDQAVHSISLLEASSIAAGSSGKGGGFLASWAIPKCIAPLSFHLHGKLAHEHDGVKEWGFRAVSAAEIKLRGRQAEGVGCVPGDLDWLDPRDIQLYKEVGTPNDSAQVHPLLFTNKLAKLAEERGVKIVKGHATRINYNENVAQVASVAYTTNDGNHQHIIGATDILVAAGPWSSRLLPQVKLQAPKGHSIVVRPATKQSISPYILFTEIETPTGSLSPDIYPRPPDSLNSFDTFYTSGPDHYDQPLPALASDVHCEADKYDELWDTVSGVCAEIIDGEIITTQACYKAQIRKHGEGEETGPMVGPMGGVAGLWLATGLDEWGVQNGPGVGLVMSEMILEGRARSADVEALKPERWM